MVGKLFKKKKNVSRNYSHYKEQLIPVFWIKQGGVCHTKGQLC